MVQAGVGARARPCVEDAATAREDAATAGAWPASMDAATYGGGATVRTWRTRPCVADAATATKDAATAGARRRPAGARRSFAGARQGFAGVEERGGVVVVERKLLSPSELCSSHKNKSAATSCMT